MKSAVSFQHCPQQHSKQNENLKLYGSIHAGPPKTSTFDIPTSINPYLQSAVGSILPFPHPTHGIDSPAHTTGMQTEASTSKQFVVIDQSGDRTSLFITSVKPSLHTSNVANLDMKRQRPDYFLGHLPLADKDVLSELDKTDLFDGNEGSEMHEDTEEINALLYSDSENQEASAGCSHKNNWVDKAVACSSGMHPKRRRLNENIDPSLMDTASSAEVCCLCLQIHKNVDANEELSFVRGTSKHGVDKKASFLRSNSCCNNRKMKMDQIHEIVGILRQIIPGSERKDAFAVLDEAIQYLQFLKHDADALRNSVLKD